MCKLFKIELIEIKIHFLITLPTFKKKKDYFYFLDRQSNREREGQEECLSVGSLQNDHTAGAGQDGNLK